jgi:hypothetical protein
MSRSGSLGFYDLEGHSGYYHYPILRASCWINMIAAGGLVVVPEGSSSCVCGYNYKTSMALVPGERQYHYGISWARPGDGVDRLMINFGAPGDRPDGAGRVWHGYPRPVAYGRPLAGAKYGPKRAGGSLPVRDLLGDGELQTYSRNPDWLEMEGTETPWLYSCGISGPLHLEVAVSADGSIPREYRLVLYFCELVSSEHARVFDVSLQGETVLPAFDILQAGGKPLRAVTREFTVTAGNSLVIELSPRGEATLKPIISGFAVERLD